MINIRVTFQMSPLHGQYNLEPLQEILRFFRSNPLNRITFPQIEDGIYLKPPLL